jgi:putative transcriptional regulator
MIAKMSKREIELIKRDIKDLKDFESGKIKELKGWLTVRVLLPPKPAQIKGLRKRLKLTQEGLARLLNSGVYAVRSWEQGQRVPDGPVTLLFQMIAKDAHVLKAARETMGLTLKRG